MKKTSISKYILYPFLSYRAKSIAKLIQNHIPSGSTVLDIGCGNMLISKRLKKNINLQIKGIDVIDMNMTDLPFRIFNGHSIPFPDNSFDVCLFIGVLHHADNQKALLKEARRVTKKKIIIFEDVFFSKIGKFWLKVRDVIGNVPEEINMNFSFKFNSIDQWRNIFIKHKLKTIYKEVFFNYLRFTHHAIFVLEKKPFL